MREEDGRYIHHPGMMADLISGSGSLSGKEFADEVLDAKYGKGNYKKGPTSEHSKIKKWVD